MSELAPVLKQRFFNSNGAPLAGGQLFTYIAGTTIPLATYTDQTGGTPNSNPVILDANGQADVWLGNFAYKFVLEDSLGNIQWTVDNVQSLAYQISSSVTSTVSSSTPLVLTAASSANQVITGSVAQTLQLPVATTLPKGQPLTIFNNSSAVTTVQTSGGNTIQAMAANTALKLLLLNPSGGTGTASWLWIYGPASGTALSIAGGGTNNGSLAVTAGGVVYTDGSKLANVGVGISGQFLKSNAGSAPTWANPTITAPLVTKYTSSSGTHTFTGSPLYVKVVMCGGGAGGTGSGTGGAPGAGTGGGNTSFGTSLLVANGGAVGAWEGSGGLGGTATLGSGPTGVAITGGYGGGSDGGVAGERTSGGSGGMTPYFCGGGAATDFSGGGVQGVANTGGGGQGGGSNAANLGVAGAGGASGGFVDAIISGATLASLSGSAAYVVGAGGSGGTAGTSGFAGGAGAAGQIIVTEYYQ